MNRLDIIDPIHDFIQVSDQEIKIIDTPAFQRLRRIKQLSGAYLTYPGAQHTRFEHSLGVMHIASQSSINLKEKSFLNSEDVDYIRMASLLHDIGHGPFSHLFEEILQEKKKITHEDIGKKIILKSEIGDLLSKIGFNKRKISQLAFGEFKTPFMNEIISGILSADMMDYLLRDGYFTGAEHAKIDHKRITQSLNVFDKKLALDRSALYSFESMMHSRYQMFKAVYFHKTVRSAEVMLAEAMRQADDELNLTSIGQNEYLNLTDETVMAKLLSLPNTKYELKRAKKFAQDYQNRNLLKCVYERIFTGKKTFQPNVKEIRNELAKKSGIDENDVFVDSSKTPSIPLSPSNKESQFVILTSKERRKTIASKIPISEIPLVSVFSGFMDILRVYTTRKNRNKVESAAKVTLGRINL